MDFFIMCEMHDLHDWPKAKKIKNAKTAQEKANLNVEVGHLNYTLNLEPQNKK